MVDSEIKRQKRDRGLSTIPSHFEFTERTVYVWQPQTQASTRPAARDSASKAAGTFVVRVAGAWRCLKGLGWRTNTPLSFLSLSFFFKKKSLRKIPSLATPTTRGQWCGVLHSARVMAGSWWSNPAVPSRVGGKQAAASWLLTYAIFGVVGMRHQN